MPVSRSPASPPLNEDMDAQRWAKEFIEVFDTFPVGGAAVDEGLMISWFANAIMCGYDVGRRKLRTELASSETANQISEDYLGTPNDLEKLRSALQDIEMETRKGGQWTTAEINEVASAALAGLGKSE